MVTGLTSAKGDKAMTNTLEIQPTDTYVMMHRTGSKRSKTYETQGILTGEQLTALVDSDKDLSSYIFVQAYND